MNLKRLFASSQVIWLFALACPRAWTLFIIRPLYSYDSSCFMAFYGAEALTAALVALVALLRGRDAGTGRLPKTPLPLALLMCAPTVLFIAPVAGLAPWLPLATSVLAGATMAWCYLQCAFVYGRLQEREAVFFVLASFAIGAALRFPLELLPATAAGVIVAPLPLACLLMCRRASAYVGELSAQAADSASAAPHSRPMSAGALVPYVVLVVLYGLTLGAFQVALPDEQSNLAVIAIGMLVKVALPIALLAFVLSSSKSVDLGLMCQIGLLLIFTALVLTLSFYDNEDSPVAGMASDYARNIFNFMLVATLAVLVCRMPHHPFATFGFGWALLPATELGGLAISHAAGAALYDRGVEMYVFYVLVLVTVIALIAGVRSNRDTRLFTPEAADPASFERYTARQQALGALAQQGGLTERESEVATLICEGRSKRYIAERLSISENTVRTHTRKVYDKLGIHSRQELLDLIEERAR